MEIATIVSQLESAGFRVLAADQSAIFLQDPTCLADAVMTFMEYAWIAIALMFIFVGAGWAFALFRGAKVPFFANAQSIVIIFGTLTVAMPAANALWGAEITRGMCKTITVPADEISKIMQIQQLKNRGMNPDGEFLEIWDSEYDSTTALSEAELEDFFDEIFEEELPEDSPPQNADAPAAASAPTPAADLARAYSATANKTFDGRNSIRNSISVLSAGDIQQMRDIIAEHNLRIGNTRRSSGTVNARRDNGRRAHQGTDLAAAPGDSVYAFFDGVVTAKNPMHHGLMSVRIQNDNGTTAYIGYVSAADLQIGDRVAAGQIVGTAQRIGMAPAYRNTPNHVHYELWQGRKVSTGGTIIDIQDIM